MWKTNKQKSFFGVVGLLATLDERKGNLVGQTPGVLDPVDELQAAFPGWRSHSAYIHLFFSESTR